MSCPAEVMLIKNRQPDAKRLLGDQHREGSANRTPNKAEIIVIAANAIEIGVIAGPSLVVFGAARLSQGSDDVAIGIENTNRRNVIDRDPFLAPRFPQKVLRSKRRRLAIVLVS